MEVYFEAMRFVSISLDFKCIHGGFNKGHARTRFLVLMNSALPEDRSLCFVTTNRPLMRCVSMLCEAMNPMSIMSLLF